MSDTITPAETDLLDEQLSVLADRERRAIITHFRDAASHTATLDSLATVLAADSPTERDYARIRLHHIHLPKLADTPLLSYDHDTATVAYHGHPELELLLNTVDAFEATEQRT